MLEVYILQALVPIELFSSTCNQLVLLVLIVHHSNSVRNVHRQPSWPLVRHLVVRILIIHY